MSENQIHELPGFIRWFLRLVCPEMLFEEIEGDLIQRYNDKRQTQGAFRAGIGLFYNTLLYVRPGILFRNRIRSLLSVELMFNYMKTTTRVMLRNKMFTFINVSGLTLGITGAVFLFIAIADELSFDTFHPDAERIYTGYNRTVINGDIQCWGSTPRILAPTLREEYPGVEQAISVAQWGSPYLLQSEKEKLTNDQGIFTEPGFLQIFDFPLLHGDPSRALESPSSIVLSRELAQQLFFDGNALGETVSISDSGYDFDFTVTGILNDLPGNTMFRFDYILPFSFLENLEGPDENWLNNSVYTFVKLDESTSVESMNESLAGIIQRRTNDLKDPEIFLYPLTRMHLYGQFENGVESGGRMTVQKMIFLLGILLLVIASINFINLSTARAAQRAREIGVRKVNGAPRSALIAQFLTESHILTLIAYAFGIMLVYFLMPGFNLLFNKQLEVPFDAGWFWGMSALIIISLGMLAGTYPALALSSFRPTIIFQKTVSALGGSFRKGLVILQFGFAVTMIFSVVVIHKQIQYVQERQAGYDKDRLITHTVPGNLNKSAEAYRNELLESGIASSVSFTASKITEDWSSTYSMEWPGKEEDERITVNRYVVDDYLVETAGLNIVMGRNLDFATYPSDSTGALINEAAVREMGLEDPIGAVIQDDARRLTVVGVIEDFVLKSPMQKIEPILLIPNLYWKNIVNIRLAPSEDLRESLTQVAEIYQKFEPDYPFEYEFVDEVYARKFNAMKKTEKISQMAGVIVILIACLGLYGLTLYVIQQRLQEVSIRRVFGGSVASIMRLLAWRSLSPILWAILIFIPWGWFSMRWWLNSFDYHIDLQVSHVLITGAILIAMSLMTVIFQIWRTSTVNPAEVLKRE